MIIEFLKELKKNNNIGSIIKLFPFSAKQSWFGNSSIPTWLYLTMTTTSEGWCAQNNATNITECGGLDTGGYGEGGDV